MSAPFVVVTTWILYKRGNNDSKLRKERVTISLCTVVLGEKPRVSDGHAIRPMGVRERDEKDSKLI